MKTVKDISELKRLALAKGASVEVGATRYNTTGERVAAMPRKEAPPEPAAPPPTLPPPPAPEVRVDLAPVAQAQERLGQLVAQMMSQLPQPAAPVREWLFTVERDNNGLLTSIRAIAQE